MDYASNIYLIFIYESFKIISVDATVNDDPQKNHHKKCSIKMIQFYYSIS